MTDTKAGEPKPTNEEVLLETVHKIAVGMGDLQKKIEAVSKDVDKIKEEKKEDLKKETEKAEIKPETPPDIVETVHNILGKEFGVEVESQKDFPGYMLKIKVPEKYQQQKSTVSKEELVRKEELLKLMPTIKDRKEYSKLWEELFAINGKIVPTDYRCKMISVADGIEGVKKYTMLVQSNIFKAHQREGKALPK